MRDQRGKAADVTEYRELIARARQLAESGRRILGITGPPGAGKGLVARRIRDALAPRAVVVPMDGFHLANRELRRLGLQDRKGAPETFDAAGYIALLRRIRDAGGETVYAPEFHREVEESYAGSIPVGPEVELVITEGSRTGHHRGQLPAAGHPALVAAAGIAGRGVVLGAGRRGAGAAAHPPAHQVRQNTRAGEGMGAPQR